MKFCIIANKTFRISLLKMFFFFTLCTPEYRSALSDMYLVRMLCTSMDAVE